MKEPDCGLWDPLWRPQTTTKVVVVVGAADAGYSGCPAAYFGGVWGPDKKSKKCRECGNLKTRWEVTKPQKIIA